MPGFSGSDFPGEFRENLQNPVVTISSIPNLEFSSSHFGGTYIILVVGIEILILSQNEDAVGFS